MIYDQNGNPKVPYINRQDGFGEVAVTNVYVNDQDGAGERLVWTDTGTIIASFEDAEFDDNWGGRKDTVNGDLVTTTARAVHGTNSLHHPVGAGYDETRSMPGDGLPKYIGVPSQQRFYIWFENWATSDAYWSFCRRNNGNDRLYLRLWGSSDRIFFNETVAGTTNTIARDNAAGLTSGAWLEVTITVNDNTGTYAGLLDWEPRVEVYTVDASFNRVTLLSDIKGDDASGDAITISASNRIAEGEGGYSWEFQGNSFVDVDYHHEIA